MKTPDIKGPSGEAWRMDLTKRRSEKPDFEATVAMTLLKCPQAHPFWNHWMVSLISLRPIPGVRDATKLFPEATHELLVLALDPGAPLPDPDNFEGGLHYLTPPDHVVHFEVPTDAAALAVFEKMVEECCQDLTSPDQDYRAYWRSHIPMLAAHQRGEHRGEN